MFQTKSLIVAIVGFALSILYGKIFSQELFYSNNFEGLVDTEWSNKRTDVTPVGGRRFLGQFGNGTVSLTLPNIPFHKQVRVSFDLFIIRSWDGNYQRDPRFPNLVVGPDVWSLSVAGGSQLVRTTFSNIDSNPPLSYNQAYPENYPDGNNPPRTGSTEINTLGYHFDYGGDKDAGDTVYRFESSFPHTTSSLKMQFNASGLQSLEDESWGLDNVKVELISENQPPVITHTPITSAIQGKEIWFSMDVVDDQDQLKTLAIYARITGERDFTSYPFVVSKGQTHYEMGISSLTQTLDGVEYYIEAMDEQGLTSTHGSAESPHHVCVTNPNKKTPVIIIPGILGTELWDMEKNEKIWIDLAKATDPLNPKDLFLLRLLLQNNGLNPDINKRCEFSLDMTCTTGLSCPFLSCVDGGSNQMVAQGIVTLAPYKELATFLESNGYIFGKDLFLLGYDWRLNLGYYKSLNQAPLPEALRGMIESVAPKCQDKVNIIAHSLGGLLLRSYLKWCQDKDLDHHIDTTIYLGTPHKGTPKAYGVLKWAHSLLPFLYSLPVYGLNRHTMSFISQNFPSAYQLLPRYNFIEDKNGKLEDFKESFLNLSNQTLVAMAREFHESIKNYNPVERSFAINGSGQLTPLQYKVRQGDCIEVIPDPTGDGTVPMFSSSTFTGTKTFFVKGKHSDLPGIPQVHEKILNILEGKENDSVVGVRDTPFAQKLILVGLTCSPITLHISDSEGNSTGLDEIGDIQENIPDSQFFVFSHNEAVFLSKENDYLVKIKAIETGTFTLIFKTIDSEGSVIDQIEYRDIPTSKDGRGEVILNHENLKPELSLDVDGDGTSDFNILPEKNPPEELQNMFAENGDVNKDKRLDISDAVAILGHLFLGTEIACPNARDTNSDLETDISDPIYLLGYLFLGTAEKPKGLIFCP